MATITDRIKDAWVDAHTSLANDAAVVAAINNTIKTVKIPFTGGLENKIAFAWENPETTQIILLKCIIDITTAGTTSNAVLNVGITANATSTDDTIIDGLAVTSLIVGNEITNKGVNGKGIPQKIDANGGTAPFITGKLLVAESAALIGTAYIEYITV